MSGEQLNTEESIDGFFDSVTYGMPGGVCGTLTGELPYRIDGFDWQCVTEDPERVTSVKGSVAAGVVEGKTIARGIVHDVCFDGRGRAELFVSPPQ